MFILIFVCVQFFFFAYFGNGERKNDILVFVFSSLGDLGSRFINNRSKILIIFRHINIAEIFIERIILSCRIQRNSSHFLSVLNCN